MMYSNHIPQLSMLFCVCTEWTWSVTSVCGAFVRNTEWMNEDIIKWYKKNKNKAVNTKSRNIETCYLHHWNHQQICQIAQMPSKQMKLIRTINDQSIQRWSIQMEETMQVMWNRFRWTIRSNVENQMPSFGQLYVKQSQTTQWHCHNRSSHMQFQLANRKSAASIALRGPSTPNRNQ